MVSLNSSESLETANLRREMLARFKPENAKNPQEVERFGKMVELMLKAPQGRETVEEFLEKKCDFRSKTIDAKAQYAPNAAGPRLNEININFDKLPSNSLGASILVHEMTHALQDNNMVFKKYNAASQFMIRRAREADACAKQALFICQTKNIDLTGYSAAKNEIGFGNIIRTTEKALHKTNNDEEKALSVAFQDWYRQPDWVEIYDQNYKKDIAKDSRPSAMGIGFGQFKKEADLPDFCIHKGKSYISPDFFSEPEARFIKKDTCMEINKMLKGYAKETGEKQWDNSLYSMTLCQEYQKGETPRMKREIKPSLQSSLNQIQEKQKAPETKTAQKVGNLILQKKGSSYTMS